MSEKIYKKHMTVLIISALVLAGISFYAGNAHGAAAAKTAFASARSQFGMGGTRMGGASRFGMGGGAVTGSVIAKDATSVTVKGRDGSSKIVLYSGSTQISKSAAGSIDDIIVGSQVSAIGTQNSDGSVTAQTIQLRPAMPSTSTPTPAQ